ncbi:MAG TPA: Xaa-Pro peptidase family protein [Terriglobia bacterium]|nr:Xaa-Pro peptidase family protein [Terriglobia bacterium]
MRVVDGRTGACDQFPEAVFRGRRARLEARMEALRLRFVLVTKPVDVFYLTGFRGSAGALVISPGRIRLWVDPRYTLQAREQSRGAEVIETRKSLLRAIGGWARRARPSVVGCQDAHLTGAELAELRRESQGSRGARWRGVGAVLDELRIVKDRWEIERMRQAGGLTARVFGEVLPLVKPGVCECDLAAELEFRMKRGGGEGPAFETIVASGPRGAWPHARASARPLRSGELVIFDLGAILAGYASDMTRTLYLGVPRRRARLLYESVAEAQRETVLSLRAGLRGGDADAVARHALARRNLERYFTHSTGHGVGLEVHERPRLARGEHTALQAGAVVTVEPGVYVEGYGGVRIEDTVLISESGPEILTPAAKEPWYTG